MTGPSAFEVALGQEIRAWRQRRKLTLTQLADVSGVSKATIERLENATHGASVANVWKLADALEVPFSTVVSRAEQMLQIDQVPAAVWDRPADDASADAVGEDSAVEDLPTLAEQRAKRTYPQPVKRAARKQPGKKKLDDE